MTTVRPHRGRAATPVRETSVPRRDEFAEQARAAMACVRTLNEMRKDLVRIPFVRCHYVNTFKVQCSAEAVDPVGEVLLCARHLGRALELLKRTGVVK